MTRNGRPLTDEERAAIREKMKATGIRRYGSEKAWRKAKAEHGLKATRTGKGGFAHLKRTNPEKLKQISSQAAKKRFSEN